ncbi:hypothetical protein JHK82_051145 [Glycine max]|nr:hypothetical protein JHK82_051145 [Glycine max]
MTKTYQIVLTGSSWGIRNTFYCFIAILISTLLVVTTICLRQDRGQLSQKINAPSDSSSSKCDLFSGKWVFDNESYPLYKEQQCTFMSDELACEKFGRKDLSYQNWRRKPHQYCDLPRFNATALLKRLRNKRLVFVGDSLIRGQWVSMICLVDSILPSTLKSMHSTANESNSDDPVNHKVPERTVRVKAIGKHARYWTDADFLVFNTYLWWRRPVMDVLWGSFGDPDGVYKGVEMLRVYGMALRTWFDWLEVHVNRNKTHLFFVSMSPIHERCPQKALSYLLIDINVIVLIVDKTHNPVSIMTDQYDCKRGVLGGSDPKMMCVVEDVLDDLKPRGLNVQMLNITQLSEYRKEGHPSIYSKQWYPLTQGQIANPNSYADCIHWCLPVVPDVWNELLYAYIFNQ